MRIRVLTAWMLSGIVVAQTAAKPLHADRVVTDEEIEEIWKAVADGTPIEIRP